MSTEPDDHAREREAAAGAGDDGERRGEEAPRYDLVEDAESSPAIPSAALAALAAIPPRLRRALAPSGSGEIWRLSWPVMLSQGLVTVVALVDIAMVGRLGAGHVAAVGYATQFFFMIQSALFAVGFACVALMARSIGAGEPQEARLTLGASLAVSVTTACAMAGAILAAPRALLHVLNAEPEVIELSVPYMRLVLGSSVILAVSFMLESSLRADRDTVTPMVVAVAVAAVKIALNAVLIFGLFGAPRLELVGAGLATLVSQIVGFVAFATLARRRPSDSPLALRLRDLAGAPAKLREVVRLATPGVGERVILNVALLSYFAILGNYGTVAVAAYTVGVRTLAFSWIPGMGFAAAVAPLVGQALGRGDGDEATRLGWRAARLAVTVAVVFGVIAALARGPIARLFTDDAETIATLGPFLLCLAIAQPMLQVHFTVAGALRGAGDTWTPLLAATVGNWCFRVPLALLFAYVLHTTLVCLWAALIFDHSARALWMCTALRRGRWRERALGPSPAVA